MSAPTSTLPPAGAGSPSDAGPGGPGTTAYATSNTSFWESLGGLGVRRDRTRGWVGGVCVGIADRLRVDPLLIRALAVVLLFTGGVGLIIYLVAWLLLPDTEGRVMLREAGNGNVGAIALIVILAVVMFSGLSFSDGPFWMGGWLFPAVLIALVAIWLANRGGTDHGARSTVAGHEPMAHAAPAGPADLSAQGGTMSTTYAPSPTIPPVPGPSGNVPPAGGFVPPVPRPIGPPPPPRPQRRRAPRGFGAVVLGLAVLGYGLGLVLDGPTEFNGSGPFLGLLIALGISSLAALGLGLTGRRGGFASVLTLLLIVPVGLTAIAHKVDFEPDSARVVTWSPTAAGGYNIGAGDATLDLAKLPPGEGIDLTASVGVGTLTVLVPHDTEVTLNASVGAGDLDLTGVGEDASGGLGSNLSTVIDRNGDAPSPTTVNLQANVGLGDLIVKEK
jgi:phage shock protein PspC (stress-responsive transcriptional regulator)